MPAPDGAMEFVGIIVDETEQRQSGTATRSAKAPTAAGTVRYARLLPQHYHSYPPDYRRQWFPVLDRHPDTAVVPQP